MANRPWAPGAADRALAAALGPGAAFVAWNDRWLHVVGPTGPGRRPVLDLAQALWELDAEHARTALRNRFRTTDPVTPVDRAVVDVAAKRVAFVAGAPGPAPASEDVGALAAQARARSAPLDVGERRVPRDVVGWLRALIPAGEAGPLALRDRPVVAVLVDTAGEVRAAATNTAGRNRTLHAEMCLVQGWGALPAGWTVLTSLQPCRMCAAVLVDAAQGPLSVRYLAADLGRLASRTLLQAAGWESALS